MGTGVSARDESLSPTRRRRNTALVHLSETSNIGATQWAEVGAGVLGRLLGGAHPPLLLSCAVSAHRRVLYHAIWKPSSRRSACRRRKLCAAIGSRRYYRKLSSSIAGRRERSSLWRSDPMRSAPCGRSTKFRRTNTRRHCRLRARSASAKVPRMPSSSSRSASASSSSRCKRASVK